jgi:hypothetical protein
MTLLQLIRQDDLGCEELRQDLGIARARSGIARVGYLFECGSGFGCEVLRHVCPPAQHGECKAWATAGARGAAAKPASNQPCTRDGRGENLPGSLTN